MVPYWVFKRVTYCQMSGVVIVGLISIRFGMVTYFLGHCLTCLSSRIAEIRKALAISEVVLLRMQLLRGEQKCIWCDWVYYKSLTILVSCLFGIGNDRPHISQWFLCIDSEFRWGAKGYVMDGKLHAIPNFKRGAIIAKMHSLIFSNW